MRFVQSVVACLLNDLRVVFCWPVFDGASVLRGSSLLLVSIYARVRNV